MKCLVKGCPNDSAYGGFVGQLCVPCHNMLTTGVVLEGQTFIHRIAAPATTYRYREGVHGEHCIDHCIWSRFDTIGRAATQSDAEKIIKELNKNEPRCLEVSAETPRGPGS